MGEGSHTFKFSQGEGESEAVAAGCGVGFSPHKAGCFGWGVDSSIVDALLTRDIISILDRHYFLDGAFLCGFECLSSQHPVH